MHAHRLYIYRRYAVKTVVGLILSFCQSAGAQGPGGFGGGILLLSPSATANGMGNGFVAASTEASALYYNPAALARTGRLALEGNTFKLFEESDDFRFHHISGAVQTGWLTGLWLGAAYERLNLGEEVVTSETDPMPIGIFKPYEWTLTFAAAAKINQHARCGVGFRYYRGVLAPKVSNTTQKGDGTGSTYTFSFGLLYDGLLPSAHLSWQRRTKPLLWGKRIHQGLAPGFSLGVALTNLGPEIKYFDADLGHQLPRILRLGLAWNFLESSVLDMAATGEIAKTWLDRNDRRPNSITFASGLELDILDLAAVRYGHYWDNDEHMESNYNTWGFSVGPPGLRFSYAKINPESPYFAERSIFGVAMALDKLP